jgi:hypothetical protein
MIREEEPSLVCALKGVSNPECDIARPTRQTAALEALFLSENSRKFARCAVRRILLTVWDSLLSFGLAWRTSSGERNVSNLQGLKIGNDAF